MKKRGRKQYSAALKAKIAVEAVKGQRTIQELASHYEVHPNMVTKWKKQVLDGVSEIFSNGRSPASEVDEQVQAELYQQIGKLQIEVEWLKKVGTFPLEQRRPWIESNHDELSIVEQCRLTGVSRSGLYYTPVGESAENIALMRLLDEQYTRTPFYGIRRMTWWLETQGRQVNAKRVRRLLRLMGLEAIYPKPRLSMPAPGHRIYPYQLRNLEIVRPDQVWATDITYIRLRQGFIYLVAIMDWFSRYVLAWEVSTSMDSGFCVSALDWALRQAQPEIFNTDQGAQFTSDVFTSRLEDQGITISMDGRGRFLDNIFVERLWRTVKYEEVYLKDYLSVSEAISNLNLYFRFYNQERGHQVFDYQTPETVYFQRAPGACGN